MCKFHKEVARDIATVNGQFNPAQYMVAMLAMGKFRTEQVMPSMYGCAGYDPAEMITETAVQALAGAGLPANKSCINSTLKGVKAYRDAHIGEVQDAMALTAQSCDLTMEGLNAPPLPNDPTENGDFLNDAVVNLFDGYDDEAMTKATGPLTLKAEAHKPQFEALRMATEHFIGQPQVEPVLKQMFDNKLVEVFRTAKRDFEAGLGQKKDCHMCHHGDPQPAPGQ